jgi:hypothetical protein
MIGDNVYYVTVENLQAVDLPAVIIRESSETTTLLLLDGRIVDSVYDVFKTPGTWHYPKSLKLELPSELYFEAFKKIYPDLQSDYRLIPLESKVLRFGENYFCLLEHPLELLVTTVICFTRMITINDQQIILIYRNEKGRYLFDVEKK